MAEIIEDVVDVWHEVREFLNISQHCAHIQK